MVYTNSDSVVAAVVVAAPAVAVGVAAFVAVAQLERASDFAAVEFVVDLR